MGEHVTDLDATAVSAVGAAADGLSARAWPTTDPGIPAVAPDALRRAFRRHAAGVTVVTLAGPSGPVGFTATSVASLSATPPLVSLSFSATSSSASAMLAADTAVIHLLSTSHEEIARRFATSGIDRFAPPVRWKALPTGEPLLSEVAVWLRVRLQQRLETGQSYLVVGQVLDSHTADDDGPLVYHDGRYGTITDLTPPGATGGEPEA